MASISTYNGKNGITYKITVSCGYTPNGKKITKTKTVKADKDKTDKQNYKDVQRIATEFENTVINGLYMDGERLSFGEYTVKWLEEYAIQQLEPTTYETYNRLINAYIMPELSHYKIKSIKPFHIQQFYNHLINDNVRKDGKKGGLSTATVKKIGNIISRIFNSAIEWEITDKNPCTVAKVPPNNQIDTKEQYLTPEQAIIFLNALNNNYEVEYSRRTRSDNTGKIYSVNGYTTTQTIPLQYKVFFNIALYGGLRRGEILALTFDDIDFINNIIHIRKSNTYCDHKILTKSTKTKHSIRDISVPKNVINLIHQLQVEQHTKKLKYGTYWKNIIGFLFTQDDGLPMSPSTPYHALKKIIQRYNATIEKNTDLTKSEKQALLLPDITVHSLRHTSATLLISQSVDIKTVSARLGHAQTSTTMNIYAHALKQLDKKASEVLSQVLNTN